jgi:Protein of unknown function (DUF2924)
MLDPQPNATGSRPAAPQTSLSTQLAVLAQADLPSLRGYWQARWGTPPPLRSVDLLRLSIAWRLQAEDLGGLDRAAKRQIARTGRLQPEGQELGLGARLRREWQGRMVEVVVTPEGFRWEDRSFPSLSAAATAIAGTRWNGPRFFGLRGDAK